MTLTGRARTPPRHWARPSGQSGLTSGDYNNSGADDLVPLGTITTYESLHPVETVGAASYFPGGRGGLTYGLCGGSVGACGDIDFGEILAP
ncbi:hypothetical protein [Streptomyces sp. NBC_00872]|uniref:hypothetical protein n=1 Tax=Streptomyces sp. NBC_00872 TaxID=2903686 RepID=UPI00386C6254|nr:hypothetical protein OG214_02150 [Streptomyces sp. NBC_00872]